MITVANNNNNFSEILQEIPEEKHEFAKVLLEKAIFTIELLKEIERAIKERGVVEDYRYGGKEVTRENPAVKQYVQVMRTFRDIVSQLLQLMKKKTDEKERDELAEFLLSRAGEENERNN